MVIFKAQTKIHYDDDVLKKDKNQSLLANDQLIIQATNFTQFR